MITTKVDWTKLPDSVNYLVVDHTGVARVYSQPADAEANFKTSIKNAQSDQRIVAVFTPQLHTRPSLAVCKCLNCASTKLEVITVQGSTIHGPAGLHTDVKCLACGTLFSQSLNHYQLMKIFAEALILNAPEVEPLTKASNGVSFDDPDVEKVFQVFLLDIARSRVSKLDAVMEILHYQINKKRPPSDKVIEHG